jgi:hypothetical protein
MVAGYPRIFPILENDGIIFQSPQSAFLMCGLGPFFVGKRNPLSAGGNGILCSFLHVSNQDILAIGKTLSKPTYES